MITIQDWEQTIGQIKKDFVKRKSIEEYNLWILGIRFIGADASKVIIELPSYFFRDVLNKKGYMSLIRTKLFEFTQNRFDFDIRIKSFENTNNSDM